MVKQAPTPNLSERAKQVLADVVESYGTHGEPVGSKALVQSGKYNLSGASIRNVMQDLELAGLLKSPHTSAGRIPTEEGFRFYAQKLVKVDNLSDKLKADIKQQASLSKPLSTLIKDVSSTVSQLTGCASMVTSPKREDDVLEHMEFIRLSGDRVLVVMVSRAGEIENRIIEVPEFIDTADLQKAARTLRPMLAGQTLEQARSQLVSALAEQKLAVNRMIDEMMTAAHQFGQPTMSDGAMVVAGSTQLFQYPELVREQLQKLVKVFEEKRLLMALVEEVKQGPGVKIFVGRDVPVEGAEDTAVVAAPFGKEGKGTQHLGTIGVIGPMRMNYKTTIGVINYTTQLLNRVLTEGASA
ncbi:MAG: heat-inducible transcription repressor HrcA [Pseudomonadaceae bacterium]|nr:heat-inducible transcription repressor HrcA [Pseudomonadaceae bacterium]